jgi:hypothetical protein
MATIPSDVTFPQLEALAVAPSGFLSLSWSP